VRVVERGDRLRLALEALARLRIGRHLSGEHLDRDGAVEPRVAGPVDLAHAARSDGGLDLIRPETRAGHEGHVGSGRIICQSALTSDPAR